MRPRPEAGPPGAGPSLRYLVKTDETMRSLIAKDKIRIDGRQTDEVRPITCEVGVLARAHGSALFTRGQTQILNALTLGMMSQEQVLDGIAPETSVFCIIHTRDNIITDSYLRLYEPLLEEPQEPEEGARGMEE